MDQDERVPGSEPDNRVLRASGSRLWLYFVGSCGFSAGGIWMIVSGDLTGWVVFAFFGVCAVVFARAGRRPFRLVLTRWTMAYSVSGTTVVYEFRRCGVFREWATRQGKWPFIYTRWSVTFSYDDDSEGVVRRYLGLLSEAVGAESHGISASAFGMSGAELADLLNGYRAQALSGGTEAPTQA